MAELGERQQCADEKTADFIEVKARLVRRLNIPDERFTVEASIQGMHEDIRRDVVLQHPQTIKALRIAANCAESSARRTCSNATTRNDTTMDSYMAEIRALIIGMQQQNGRKLAQTTNNGTRTEATTTTGATLNQTSHNPNNAQPVNGGGRGRGGPSRRGRERG